MRELKTLWKIQDFCIEQASTLRSFLEKNNDEIDGYSKEYIQSSIDAFHTVQHNIYSIKDDIFKRQREMISLIDKLNNDRII